jgi:hypothetical protein
LKSSIFRFVVGVVLLAVGYGGYRHYVNSHDPQVVGIPPHENADGTIDYTLALPVTADHDGFYWVVRLPKDQYIEISKPGTSDVGIVGGVALGLRTYSNQSINLLYKLPTLGVFRKSSTEDERFKTPHISIMLSNAEHDQVEWSNDFLGDGTKHCHAIGEVEKGLFAYDPTDDGVGLCPFSKASYKTVGYSVRNSKGLHIAQFECQPAENGNCNGSLHLSINRFGYFDFNYLLLPRSEYAKIIVELESVLVKATVSTTHVKRGHTYHPEEGNHDQ